MTEEDMALSKEEISAKYPKGSPDYPTHAKGCGCSGCYASWGEWRAANAALKSQFAFLMTNQSRVTDWMRTTFTGVECEDVPERSLRMAEEALELTQACGVDAATLHRLVDYVFSRPVGKPQQEIAGCLVTIYAIAGALGVDAQAEFETELARINTPEVVERCRRRQHEKRAALIGQAAIDSAVRYANDGLPGAVCDPDGIRERPFEGAKKRP